MHEGDCVYRDELTRQLVHVRQAEAKAMLEAARRFVLWLDTQA